MKHFTTAKIKATKGKEVIFGSKLFSYIDSDFKNWDTDVKGKDTKPTTLDVFEMDRDATFAQIFTNPEKQALSQGQILEFVKTHKDKLRTDSYATLFLFKVGDKFFVASVGLGGDGRLRVGVDEFSDGRVWGAEFRLRVVVPQLTLSEPRPETPRLSETLTLESALKIVKEAGYQVSKIM